LVGFVCNNICDRGMWFFNIHVGPWPSFGEPWSHLTIFGTSKACQRWIPTQRGNCVS
jgi:hypothetical protein